MRFLFAPISIVGGLIAGMVAKKIFEQIWAIFDDEEPPEAEHREVSFAKMMVAAAVQGAIFRVFKQASDHYSRRAFAGATGTWPGADRPEQK